MPARIKQTVIDRGWNRIVRETMKADNAYTKVGLPQEGEVKEGTKEGSGRKPVTQMSELVVVGAVNEFGAPNKNIPARPFIRTTYDENRSKINNLVVDEYEKIVDGSSNVKRSLALIGEWVQAKTQAKIRAIRTPPNAPSTQRRKGRSIKKPVNNPLIDTGQMIQSIQHVEVIP